MIALLIKVFWRQHYSNLAIYILEYEIPTGYDFLLKYGLLFKNQSIYNLGDSSKGKISILPRIVLHQVSDINKRESFIKYILYSGYLNKKLDGEELSMISAILGFDGGEIFYSSTTDQPSLIQNKNKIFEILNSN